MKKLFFLFLALVAIATGASAATDYGFSIRGYRITSDNYQSMSTSAWSYDPAANVLHLKDGTINSDAVPIAIHSNNPTLNVSVDGNCELYGKFDCGIIIAGGNHTFSGNGTLSIWSTVVSSNGISAGENSNTNVTFKDLSVSIKLYGGVGFNTSNFASITFEHCDFDINTSDGMAMVTTLTNACTPHLILCYANRSWGTNNGWYGYRGQGANEGPFAPNVKITRAIKYVGVNVAEPVPGQKPATTATTISSGYKVLSVEWKKKIYGNFYSLEADEVIQLGETYQVSFDLEAQGDSLFNWDKESKAAMIFTVNGNKADYSDVSSDRRAYMGYTFPELVDPRFNLWVGGVKVNKLNKDDVLGNRIVSYDPETKTLSLKSGASIHGQGRATDAATGYGAGIYSEIDGLTIDVAKGGVEVIGADDCHGIYLRGKTTIKGEGTISGKGYIGVFMGSNSADLTVDGNVMLQAEGSKTYGLGGYIRGFAGNINYYTTLTVKGTAKVLAKGELGSVRNWNDLVLEDNHAITSPVGAVWNADKHAVCDASGNPIAGEWVLITTKTANPADVNKDGTVDSADIVAVIKEMPDGDKKADVNGDTVIDSADIVAVIKAMK